MADQDDRDDREEQQERDGHCPDCGMPVHDDWAHCPDCGTVLVDEVDVDASDEELEALDATASAASPDVDGEKTIRSYALTGVRYSVAGLIVGVLMFFWGLLLGLLQQFLPQSNVGAVIAGSLFAISLIVSIVLTGMIVYGMYGWE